ncbi:DNA-binding transcriptional LysR family regulator [Pseudacidovorax sp. 1753]|uniref:LysR family transcriptional regulator n=1 Tax=Pseudacidovorax sp. 1753 TaxID=3156419 RepID=UPI003398AC1A
MKKENRNISLKQMRAFVAVAQAGSFTRAAEQMFITQSALSSLVRNLEAELDLRVFDRTTRRLELTDAGRELRQSLEQLLGDLDRITTDLQDVTAIRRGRVRIGTTPLLASTFIPAAIQAFRQDHPEITVRVLDDPVAALMPALYEGDIDLMVATLESEPAELSSTVLLSDRMVLVCDAAHPLAGRSEVGWAELLAEPVIALRKGSGLRAITDQVFQAMGAEMLPAQEVSHVSTALSMVASRMGVSVLPAYSVRYNEGLGLRAVALEAPVVQRHVRLAMLRQRTPSAASQAMHDHLMAFARGI